MGLLMTLLGMSAELSRHIGTGTVPSNSRSVKEVWDSWQVLLRDVEQCVPQIASRMDNQDDPPPLRWSNVFLAMLSDARWQIRSTNINPVKAEWLRGFVRRLQAKHSELKAAFVTGAFGEQVSPSQATQPTWRRPEQPTRAVPLNQIAKWLKINVRTVRKWADEGVIALERLSERKYLACQKDIQRVAPEFLEDSYPKK